LMLRRSPRWQEAMQRNCWRCESAIPDVAGVHPRYMNLAI
jgi:hypothetical protein